MTDGPQDDLFSARSVGRVAETACAEKAAVVGFDVKGARIKLLELLAARGPTSGEDLVDALKAEGFFGHDDRCFGAVFGVLSRNNRIRCVGYVARRRGHGTAGGRLWVIA